MTMSSLWHKCTGAPFMDRRQPNHEWDAIQLPRHPERSSGSLYLLFLALAMLSLFAPPAFAAAPSTSGVAVTVDNAAHKVTVTIDGKPFTNYLWKTNPRKPIL